MKSFHNDSKIKTKYLKRVRAHFKADEIVKGKYWEDGKGCAVGCTIHSSVHKNYETELGIPEWLAQLEDRIFEGLPNERAKLWPAEFLKAIRVGVNLNNIESVMHIFFLEGSLQNFNNTKFSEVTNVIKTVINLHKTKEPKSSAAWSAAEFAARSAAEFAARSAARSAAWFAAESAASAAWFAAEFAARSAARSAAWFAAESARSAARSAAESAAWSAAEFAARSAASAAYIKFADKLLELLRSCK